MSSTALKMAEPYSIDHWPEALHPYQLDAGLAVLNTEKVVMVVDMGMGKTVVTLTAIQDLLASFESFKVLVIAPLRVAQHTWPAEIAQWDHLDLDYALLTGPKAQRVAALEDPAPIHIINVDNLIWLVDHLGKQWPYDTVVIDESSLFKNHQSRRFKKLKSRLPQITRLIELTGTPAPNGLLDMWSQIYLVDGGQRLLRTYSGYRHTFFEGDYHGYKYTLRPGAEKQIYDRIADVTYRLDEKDHLDLPEATPHRVEVHLTPKQRKEYDEFEKEFLLQLPDDNAIAAVSAGVLAGKLLQYANGAMYLPEGGYLEIHDHKLNALAEIIETSGGRPILCAYNYKSDLERLQKRFPKARVLDKKPKTIEQWNRGEIQLLLAHPASAGHGLNLQHGGEILVWFGLTWNLEHYQQFNKRLHRQGQKRAVSIHHIVTAKTVDEEALATIGSKDATQRSLLDALRAKAKQWR